MKRIRSKVLLAVLAVMVTLAFSPAAIFADTTAGSVAAPEGTIAAGTIVNMPAAGQSATYHFTARSGTQYGFLASALDGGFSLTLSKSGSTDMIAVSSDTMNAETGEVWLFARSLATGSYDITVTNTSSTIATLVFKAYTESIVKFTSPHGTLYKYDFNKYWNGNKLPAATRINFGIDPENTPVYFVIKPKTGYYVKSMTCGSKAVSYKISPYGGDVYTLKDPTQYNNKKIHVNYTKAVGKAKTALNTRLKVTKATISNSKLTLKWSVKSSSVKYKYFQVMAYNKATASYSEKVRVKNISHTDSLVFKTKYSYKIMIRGIYVTKGHYVYSPWVIRTVKAK